MTVFTVKERFGFDVDLRVLGYLDETHPCIPKKDDNYLFRREFLRDILAFLAQPCSDALYISGPTGSGKTSGVTEVAARLNWPAQQLCAHGRMELSDLVGSIQLVADRLGGTKTTFVHGPLARAMKEGHILLINEVDLADPAELAGLNDVLEGRPLVIPQNEGEVIQPHEMFRVIVTGNSTGSGDSSGLYQGIQMQNLAALDRYRFMRVGYASEQEESSILDKAIPSLPDTIRSSMIKVANEIRRLFLGEQGHAGTLSITMSTRTLVRWARLTQTFKGAPNAIGYALDQALTFRASYEEREAILRISKDVFGSSWREEEQAA
ncbi:ATPase [Piscirickettsia litoralis]|uniref:ATPase n=2 Tax=Piscirickettsia litoralis TaxID=1891921 RepID=A0ABX3A214_9GAMM|nr:AAA family ATPase [Piscirickettsia litoralis]ODN41435.1 ATPase [Piscirickettsia litoralis]